MNQPCHPEENPHTKITGCEKQRNAKAMQQQARQAETSENFPQRLLNAPANKALNIEHAAKYDSKERQCDICVSTTSQAADIQKSNTRHSCYFLARSC